MKTKFNIGDKVRILVSETQTTPTGKYTCKKNDIGYICHIEQDYLMVEIPISGDISQ